MLITPRQVSVFESRERRAPSAEKGEIASVDEGGMTVLHSPRSTSPGSQVHDYFKATRKLAASNP